MTVPPPPQTGELATRRGPGEVSGWGRWSRSPLAADPRPATEVGVADLCPRWERSLNQVARRLAEHQASNFELLPNDRLLYELRSRGVPYVWPSAWTLVGDPSAEELRSSLKTWLAQLQSTPGTTRRCGLAEVGSLGGQRVVAALSVQPLADLRPLPTTAHAGQWIKLEAELLVPTSHSVVTLLGPRGMPQQITSSISGSTLRAPFTFSQPGPWLVQVLLSLDGGPRPALEAVVWVDVAPTSNLGQSEVPGESPSLVKQNTREALLGLLNAARETSGIPPLVRSEELEAAAALHAKAMADRHELSHDAGLGDPVQRMLALGLSPELVGENVAHAQSVVAAHRVIWNSPAHRENLLRDVFTHVGVGIVRDEDGSWWVCQVFANQRPDPRQRNPEFDATGLSEP